MRTTGIAGSSVIPPVQPSGGAALHKMQRMLKRHGSLGRLDGPMQDDHRQLAVVSAVALFAAVVVIAALLLR
jgi:hypothetical protein